MSITVRTDSYEREHGHPPRGKSYWMFRICTDRVTEKDFQFNSKAHESYEHALAAAKEIAVRRRAKWIVVLP